MNQLQVYGMELPLMGHASGWRPVMFAQNVASIPICPVAHFLKNSMRKGILLYPKEFTIWLVYYWIEWIYFKFTNLRQIWENGASRMAFAPTSQPGIWSIEPTSSFILITICWTQKLPS